MTPPAPVVIRLRDLRKNYGAFEAVRGVDLDVRAGEIFGLIGPDGAGKTSIFHILGGVMPATAGEAQVLGLPARDARDSVGYLTQAFSLYVDLTVKENLRYIGALRRVSDAEIESRGDRYLRMFGMAEVPHRLAGQLSGGMKQKLALACALIAEPRILLLDEPTTGVDPVSRRQFWDALVRLSAGGMTILVATPYLDEAERCHRVALMHDGRIRQEGPPAAIRDSLHLRRLEVRAADLGRAEAVLARESKLSDVQRFGDRLDVMVENAVSGRAAVAGALERSGLPPATIAEASPTLENAFVLLLRRLGGRLEIPDFPSARAPVSVRDRAEIAGYGLNKRFGGFQAVKDVDIEVRPGEIYGLLGAHGAGKTTTNKKVFGQAPPTAGGGELAGERKQLRSRSVRGVVGYMSQKFSLYDDLTVSENLDFFAGVYGVAAPERAAKKRWVIEFAGLTGHQDQLTGSLPGGWKQRVAFGAAILHEPRVLFLDEPTSGVDPLARRVFWRMINYFADRGTAILVTTHYLEEAEQCNRLGFMAGGRMVAEGSPTGVKQAQGGCVCVLGVDSAQRALDVLRAAFDPWRMSMFGDHLHVIVDGEGKAEAARIRGLLEGAGIALLDLQARPYSLEDVFLALAAKSAGERP